MIRSQLFIYVLNYSFPESAWFGAYSALPNQMSACSVTALCQQALNISGKYGMPGYVIPHEIYPPGYYCDPKQPLPFASIGSQKDFIALYHMGIYAKPDLLKWFTKEFPKHGPNKLDMGKSCIRFKNPAHIPYKLIGDLMKKITIDDWIKVYEANRENNK